MEALRPGIIWLNAWDLWVRIITVQPRNQPINPPPIWPVKAALFLGETATVSAKRRWVQRFTLMQWQQLNTSWGTKLSWTRTTYVIVFIRHLFLEACYVITLKGYFCSLGCTRDTVNTHLFSHLRHASQFPFISCLVPCLHANCILLLFKSVCWQGWCCWAFLLLPLSCPIRVDVQNVRRMFYGLLRNHSPAQVTQCSAMQEREGEEKIRGLYS